MSLYELVETAQAILISYILTDGSAQAVSDVVEAISVFLRRLRSFATHREGLVVDATGPSCL